AHPGRSRTDPHRAAAPHGLRLPDLPPGRRRCPRRLGLARRSVRPMSTSVTLERHGDVAVITLDDGKANALSPEVIAGVNASLDGLDTTDPAIRAVVLAGREGMFSGG